MKKHFDTLKLRQTNGKTYQAIKQFITNLTISIDLNKQMNKLDTSFLIMLSTIKSH